MGAGLTESRSAVSAQLKKILGSRFFRTSELPTKFLSFVVKKTLENRAEEIKEYSLGVEAFGRGPDFDPRIDSVVRVVARRVRDKLAEYYRLEGKSDPLVIEIPTGSYVPSFSNREPVDGSIATPASPPAVSSPADSSDLIGKKVLHYEILEQIGRGGSGLVYRAEDLRLNRGVAFKVLFPECASDIRRIERFMHEARSASAVNHANVCAIYDVGEFQGRAYIVMELVEGKTLDRFIDGKPVEVRILLDLGIQISDALATAHDRGIAHSDVRSANIVVNQRLQAKLLDFSAARAIQENQPPGSPNRELSEATKSQRKSQDIAALGSILFEMATGRRYTSESQPALRIINPAISPGLEELVRRAITTSPGLEQMSDVRDALIRMKRNLSLESSAAATISSRVSLRSLITNKWTWIGSLSVVLAILAIYFAVRPAPVPRILSYRQLTRDGQGKLGAFAVGTPAPLVTDGSRVYFNEVSGSQVMIKEVSTSGGDEVTLSTGRMEPLVVADLSPDRSQLLATEFFQPSPDQQLFTLALPSGSARALGNVMGHGCAWSPDGKQICYVRGNRLFLTGVDGVSSNMIAEFPGVPSWPRWSPDGTRLRVTVQDSSGGTSLWEVSLGDPRPRRLLSSWNDHPAECCGSWSSDGNYFVFQSTRDGRTGLWALRERLSLGRSTPTPVRLTEGPLEVWGPTFSSDGRKILAVVQQRRGELVRYDPASREFVTFLNGISADHVEFSRDAQWIAYSTYPEQTIWRSRPDGSERLQLTFAPMAAIFARWSPDGRRIAFMGNLPGKPVKIYTVASDGGTPQPLIGEDDSLEIDPNWSPDGDSIMFARLPADAAAVDDDSSIQIFNLKLKQLSQLPGSKGLTAPRWSPDGSHVVATSLSHGKWNHPAVMIFDFQSQRWKGLEDDPIDNKWWSSDGRYFYFDKAMDNDPAIYRLRLSDHAIERIVSLKEIRRSLNMMGLWMGLTPAGDPMVLRDTSIEEIYALDWDAR